MADKTKAELQAEVEELKRQAAANGQDGMLTAFQMIVDQLKEIKETNSAPVEELDNEKTKFDKNVLREKVAHFLQKCAEDEEKQVFGSSLLAETMDEVYTFTYNGVPVTLRFNDTYQVYPKFVAEFLEKKLADIYKSNARKVVNVPMTTA